MKKRISKAGLQQIFFGVAIASMTAGVLAPTSALASWEYNETGDGYTSPGYDVGVKALANIHINANGDNTNDGQGVFIRSNPGLDDDAPLPDVKAWISVWAPGDGGGAIEAGAATNITITGNSDALGEGEGVTIKTGVGADDGGGIVQVLDDGVWITNLRTVGPTTTTGIDNNGSGITNAGAISGATTIDASGAITGGSLATGDTLGVTGLSTLSGGASISGGLNNNAGGITNAGAITGATGITNTGALNSTGATTLTGATNINTTGTAATTIGSATSATNIGGTLGVTGLTTTNGITNNGNIGAGTLSTTGAATIGDTLGVTGATTLGGTLDVTGASTLNGATAINNTLTTTGNATIATAADTTNTFGSGANSSNTIGNASTSTNTMTGLTNAITGGTNTITGTTNVNATGGATTNIATTTAATTNIGVAGGANNITGTNTVLGATNINATGGATTNIATGQAATTSIGMLGGTNTIKGTTSINDSTNNATSINTGTSTGAITMGNSANTTSINSATNNIGVNGFATANNIGTNASAASTNTLGNTNAGTTVTGRGGNSTLSIANNTASLSSGGGTASNGTTGTAGIVGGGGYTAFANVQTIAAGQSVNNNLQGAQYVNRINGNTFVDGDVYINGTLNYVSSNTANTTVVGDGATDATSAGMSVVNAGQAGGVAVDTNGKLTANATPTQTSSALTVTNTTTGQTHGYLVNETQATMSGGTRSTSMTLDDNGARFSNSATGAPVKVTGVADGTQDFDAVNWRQLQSAYKGIAGVAAMNGIAGLDVNKTFALGVGVGSFEGEQAIALGAQYRFSKTGVVRANTSIASGGANVYSIGTNWSF